MQLGVGFQSFHQHLIFMLEGVMSKADRRIFNSLSSTAAVIDYLTDNYNVPLPHRDRRKEPFIGNGV
jgi:tRNA-dihydrouridine synthase 4